jgi:hypothetical protein
VFELLLRFAQLLIEDLDLAENIFDFLTFFGLVLRLLFYLVCPYSAFGLSSLRGLGLRVVAVSSVVGVLILQNWEVGGSASHFMSLLLRSWPIIGGLPSLFGFGLLMGLK